MCKNVLKLFVGVTVLAFCSLAMSAADNDFPGRTHKKYNKVPYIEIADLKTRFNEVVIVDARSRFEFDTLRIKGAINIPIALPSFDNDVLELRQKTHKTIVFYCNGHTCMKSYKATKRALKLGVRDVLAYDAGIFDWSRAYPDNAILLGKSPIDVGDIIPKKQFIAHLLDPDTFSDRATLKRQAVIVLDIRDKFQRAAVGFFPGQERWVSLNKIEKVYSYLRKAKLNNKTLFIYDEVGKQVRWLQYALERAGVRDYYFMEKGATAYYDMITDASWAINR